MDRIFDRRDIAKEFLEIEARKRSLIFYVTLELPADAPKRPDGSPGFVAARFELSFMDIDHILKDRDTKHCRPLDVEVSTSVDEPSAHYHSDGEMHAWTASSSHLQVTFNTLVDIDSGVFLANSHVFSIDEMLSEMVRADKELRHGEKTAYTADGVMNVLLDLNHSRSDLRNIRALFSQPYGDVSC